MRSSGQLRSPPVLPLGRAQHRDGLQLFGDPESLAELPEAAQAREEQTPGGR